MNTERLFFNIGEGVEFLIAALMKEMLYALLLFVLYTRSDGARAPETFTVIFRTDH